MKGIILGIILVLSIIMFSGCPSPNSGSDPPPAPTDEPAADSDAPEVEIVNPEDGALVSGTLLIAGTAIDVSAIDSVEIRIDDNSWETLAEPGHYWTYLVDTFQLTEGNHTARVRATDENGYRSDAVTVNFTVDQTVPEILINNPDHGDMIGGSTVSITAAVRDENGIKSVLVNPNQGGQFFETVYTGEELIEAEIWELWEFVFDTTAEPDGEVFISALAYDNADMYAITNIAVIIDNTPPDITILNPQDGATVSAAFDFQGTASDSQGIDRVMIKINDAAEVLAQGTTEWEFPVDLVDLTVGSNTLTVIAYDMAENFDTEQITVYADETPPDITITSPAADSYIRGTGVTILGTVINLTGTDLQIDIADGNGFVAVDNLVGTDWDHGLDTTIYGGDGQQTITVRAVDDTTFAWDEETINYYIDNTLPTGSIMSPADGNSIAQANEIIITGSASDGMKLASAVLDITGITGSQDVTPPQGTDYWTYSWDTSVANGYTVGDPVTIQLTVTDEAGNEYITSIGVTISADPPYGAITDPGSGEVVSGTIDIAGTAGDNDTVNSVGYQFNSTEGTWLPTDILALPAWNADPDFDTTSLSDGLHDLYVQITDNDTNTTVIQISIVVDNTGPLVSITYPTDANQGDDFLYDVVTITGTASDDNLASVVVDINDNDYFPVVTGLTNWSSIWDTATNPIAQEGVIIRVTATDDAGNSNTDTVTVDVKPMITSVSSESVYVNETIYLEGYNFVADVNTKVRFTSGVGTVDVTPSSVPDDNNITVDVPAGATSGDMYVVEGPGAVESNRVYLHVWEKVDITDTGNAAEQDICIEGSDTFQVMYDGGGTKDVRFSLNGVGSVQLDQSSGSGVGQNPSIAVDDLNVFVSYVSKVTNRVRVRRSINGGSGWEAIQELTDETINQDATTSIAYDPVNNVVGITYQSESGALKYVESTDNDTQPGGDFGTPEEIDGTAGAGYYSHLAYDSAGTPYVAYYNINTKAVKLAYYTGVFWAIKDVDPAALQGQFVSMALDSSDGIHISYYNGQSGDLMYAYAADTLASFTVTNVDSQAITGYYTDIAIDPVTGDPHIAYIDYSYSELKYAYYTGTGWDVIPVPDTIANVTIAKVAIAVDSTGNVFIGYGDATGGHRLEYLD